MHVNTSVKRPSVALHFPSSNAAMICVHYNTTASLVSAFALATLLLMKSKKANCDALEPNSYTKREARYEPKMARR